MARLTRGGVGPWFLLEHFPFKSLGSAASPIRSADARCLLGSRSSS
jgi:hypothetical protein